MLFFLNLLFVFLFMVSMGAAAFFFLAKQFLFVAFLLVLSGIFFYFAEKTLEKEKECEFYKRYS